MLAVPVMGYGVTLVALFGVLPRIPQPPVDVAVSKTRARRAIRPT